jgi:hypothetical protein
MVGLLAVVHARLLFRANIRRPNLSVAIGGKAHGLSGTVRPATPIHSLPACGWNFLARRDRICYKGCSVLTKISIIGRQSNRFVPAEERT